MKKLAKLTKKTIPRFNSEDAERRFWAAHDTTDYFDWTKAKQPSLASLSHQPPRFPSGYQSRCSKS